jgi:hypothetical protein
VRPFAAETTIVNGLRSPATDALVELLGADLPASAVHWGTCSEDAAVAALADGLCHAAAVTLDLSGGRPDERTAAPLVERLGPLTLLEVARSGAQAKLLVIPAATFGSPAHQRI